MRRLLFLLPLLLAVVGCTPPASVHPPVPATDRAAAVQRLLDGLSAAAARDDRPAFDDLVSPRDRSLSGRADVWFANLRTLRGELRLRATGSDAVPGEEVRRRLGDQGWLQQVVASWRPTLGSDRYEAAIWLTIEQDGGRALLAGDRDAPAADRLAARPVWLQTAVGLERRGAVTVIGAAPLALRPWVARLTAARDAVRRRTSGLSGKSWDGAVVLEVPASRQSFERALGVPDASYRRIGAVAWPRGSQPQRAGVAVVVNPAVTAGLSDDGLAVLLSHEVVHVATRSFASAAPTWLTEGFADRIAYDAYPATRRAASRPLRDAVRRGELPSGLPAESAFAAAAGDLELAYARAWSLCVLLADRYGAERLTRLYASVSAGTPLADALRTLGTTEADLVRDWRTTLRRLAR